MAKPMMESSSSSGPSSPNPHGIETIPVRKAALVDGERQATTVAIQQEPRASLENHDFNGVEVRVLKERVDELGRLIGVMEKMLGAIRDSPMNRQISISLPSLALLESIPPEQNWNELQSLIDEYSNGPALREIQRERLKWTSQEDILTKYGRPSHITQTGVWNYSRKNGIHGDLNNVQFEFVADYLMMINVF